MSEQQTKNTTPARFNLSSLAIERPVATLSLTTVVIVLGILFMGRLPVSLLPEVDYPHIRVVVNYPGVTPEVVEEQVTRVLERNLSATENLAEMHGRASEGRSYIELFFEVGTDIDLALQDAARQLERARAELPPGTDPPRLMKMDPSQQPIYEMAFSSLLFSSVELRQWIDQRLVPQLLTVRGTGTIEVAGGREREIDVVVDPERLRSYRLNINDIADALAFRNVDIASGNLTSAEYDVLARTEHRYRDAGQVANTIIMLPESDKYVRLSDLAKVTDSHREQRLFARHNALDAVQVTIMKQPDANTVDVIDGLEKTMRSLKASGFIPAHISHDTIRDDSFFIRASLRSVTIAAITGGLLAMLIIFLFLGNFRKSLIIGLTLPVAIISAFFLMTIAEISLNVLSLGGLALGVGLLIDSGLVLLENISRHQQQLKKTPLHAAHEGAREVVSALVAGTSTNLAAVLPFLLLTGLTALIFRELILTIAFAMVTALIAALALVPSLYVLTTQKESGGHNKKGKTGVLQKSIHTLSDRYRSGIPALIRQRYLLLLTASLLLAGSIWIMGQMGREFLPPVDDGRITMRFVLPLGTAPEPTRDVAILLEEAITEMPHVANYYSTSGGYFRGGQLSIRGGMIDMVVQLVPLNQRRGYSAEEWVSAFSQKVQELNISFIQERIRGPRIEGLRTSVIDDDISVGVVGEDLDVLEQTAGQIMLRLRGIEGMRNVQIGREERIPQVIIRLDDERASDMGISAEEAGRAIRAAVDGLVPTRYVTGGFEYNIRVRMPRSLTGSATTLANMPLFDAQRRNVNLGSIATFHEEMSPAHIERLNQIRIVRVNGTVNPEEATVGQVQQRVMESLKNMDIPEGYSLVFGGAADAIAETGRSMRTAIVLAVFFVFVAMAVQYEKVSSPLVILLSLPFSLTGVALMLFVTGTTLSAPVLLGIIFLVGILVNNAILLVSFANERMKQGMLPAEAVAEAGAIRLRPVLMTTLTTIFGMLPLALALGAGSELLQPLALTVIGGLIFGTLLTLLIIPGVFMIASDIRNKL
ncbi:MAG: efflux RND transporter permease subunit [Bacteroidia bacterium]|nr:MAG: efflux RND transporter permease subunit [Bacteroidia bacterium]